MFFVPFEHKQYLEFPYLAHPNYLYFCICKCATGKGRQDH